MISCAGLHFRSAFSVLLICGCFSSVCSGSHDQIRELFEWGEYGKLITILEPLVSALPDTSDSARAAEYCYYLGVAKFAEEGIEQSRRFFLKTLDLDEDICIDKKYIADEIFYLFEATKLEWESRKRMEYLEDSIASVQPVTIEKFDTLLIEKTALSPEEPYPKRRILGLSLVASGILIGGYSVYTYLAGGQTYEKFREAASVGDKPAYDRYRGILNNSNKVITGCGIVSGIVSGIGLYYTFKSGKNENVSLSVFCEEGKYAIRFSR
ncbi:MAG: hypothetical protein ACOC36_00530 [Fibrobacterota bacterium]